MRVTDEGMSTLANELQSRKAPKPMLVTDVGMATRLNALHPLKANAPMLDIDVGMPTLVTFVLSTPNSAHESIEILIVPSGKSK